MTVTPDIQAFFDRITADTGPTPYFTGEFGAAMVPFVLALAWLCWRAGGTGGQHAVSGTRSTATPE